MKVEKIQVCFEDGSVKDLEKSFALNVCGDQIDVFFIEMDAGEVLGAVQEVEYEIMHMIKNNAPSENTEIEIIE